MEDVPALFDLLKYTIEENGAVIKKRFNGIVEFNMIDVGTWTVDLKSTQPSVFKGQSNSRPDVIAFISHTDFLNLVKGRLSPQQAIMQGKLKIRGSSRIKLRLNSILYAMRKEFEKRTQNYSLISSQSTSKDLKQQIQINEFNHFSVEPTHKHNLSDSIFEMIKQTLKTEGPELVEKIKGVVQFELNGSQGIYWNVDLKNGSGRLIRGIHEADVTIQMSESDFLSVVDGKLDIQDAFMNGKIKIQGNFSLVTKLNILFDAIKPKSRL